jgi:hypothetical protein
MISEKDCEMEYNIAIMIPQVVSYNSIEIHPVSSYKDGNVICFEVCNPDFAENWSVYLHQVEGGLSCIADCKDMQTALRFVQLVRIITENWNVQRDDKNTSKIQQFGLKDNKNN